MQRKIKFRGLRTDGKGWTYGYYYKTRSGTGDEVNISIIIEDDGKNCWKVEVLPESVGQFTGLKEKNGIEIYEGDDVNVLSMNINRKVYFNKCAFGININKDIFSPIYQSHDLEITGNIHEKK